MAVAVAVATPLAPVVAVAGVMVALAPVAGAVKFTDAPATGLPFASETRAVSGVVKVEPTVVACGEPPNKVGEPAVQAPVRATTVDCAADCCEAS